MGYYNNMTGENLCWRFGGVLGSGNGQNFPSPRATMLALHLDCSTADLASQQYIGFIQLETGWAQDARLQGLWVRELAFSSWHQQLTTAEGLVEAWELVPPGALGPNSSHPIGRYWVVQGLIWSRVPLMRTLARRTHDLVALPCIGSGKNKRGIEPRGLGNPL